MAAPTDATYSLAALVAAHTAFRDLIDSGPGAGFVRFRDSSDALLAQVPLSEPSGTINGATGQFTFSIAGPDLSADADGAAAYAEFCDSNGGVHLALPTQIGVTPVVNRVVMNTTTVIAGVPLAILSATVG